SRPAHGLPAVLAAAAAAAALGDRVGRDRQQNRRGQDPKTPSHVCSLSEWCRGRIAPAAGGPHLDAGTRVRVTGAMSGRRWPGAGRRTECQVKASAAVRRRKLRAVVGPPSARVPTDSTVHCSPSHDQFASPMAPSEPNSQDRIVRVAGSTPMTWTPEVSSLPVLASLTAKRTLRNFLLPAHS